MPKQVFKIEHFHGGLNTSADPRDILEGEVSDITNAMLDEVGSIRTIGSVIAHSLADKTLDNTGAGVTQVPGAGLFYFSHDRTGAEDAGSSEAETGDEYLALYDDSDAQVWIYSLATDDWDDDGSNNGVINFKGKATNSEARPSFTSIDGVIRVSTGELSKYASGSLINDGSHFLSTETTIVIDNGSHVAVGNYLQMDDEIVFVTGISTHTLTVRRGMFGTKAALHNDNTPVYIVNMNQWYGYLDNKFFQTAAGVPEYSISKWYNEVQHLRSLDELGITLALDDSFGSAHEDGESPDATALVENKVIVSYWLSQNGLWSGSYYIGMTPVYVGGQEGPISTVGSSPIVMAEQVLNVQLYVCHPDVDSGTISVHPLGDDRIIGLNLYTKSFTSDEWFLLKKFDLLEGGEHGWKEYQSGNTTAGFWDDGSSSMDNPDSDQSYARTTADITVTPGRAMGEDAFGNDRTGTVRVSGFAVSPIYKTINLNSTSAQEQEFSVVNPSPGTAPFVIEVLDENYDVLHTTQTTKTIADSGVSVPHYPEKPPYTGEEQYHEECFLYGTNILMSSGSMKNISDINIGDSVASYSRHYESYISSIVTDVLMHPIGDVIKVAVVDNKLYGTPSHPIFFNGKWKEIHHSNLNVSYKYMYVDTYYNLEIDGDNIFGSDHNYIANGYIVSGLGDNDILNKIIPRQSIFMSSYNG